MTYDVIILGAGPAGSAAAAFLAQAGLHVALLDSGSHPRHHIGESLLPASMPLLQSLGISEKTLAHRYQPKLGARFYHPPTDRIATFPFQPSPGFTTPAYQVLRESFDELLFTRARDAGAVILPNSPVESLDENAAHVTLTDGRTLHARFLLDASGRRALIASKRNTRTVIHNYGRVGIYNYFRNLPPHDNDDPNYITMYLFDAGWVWLIPLADGRTSVGIVYRDLPRLHPPTAPSKEESLFWHAVNTMPRLAQRLQSAAPTDPFRAISDYSYTVSEKFGDRFALIGDAAGFLDPIFSSGVHLALCSAHRASTALLQKLNTGSDADLTDYATYMNQGFQVFQAFVDRFYNRGLVENLFFMEKKPPEMHAAITRILAGHVWDRSNPILRLLGLS